MKCYILMADVINSSDKKPELLMSSFRESVEVMNKRYSNKVISPLTITLGDEFQGVVDSLNAGIDLIFALDQEILLSVQPYSLRYVLVYGEIATEINRTSAHGMLGEGLTQARRQLDSMKKGDLEIHVEGIDEDTREKLNLAFGLYRGIYNDWPDKDRQTAYDLIYHEDYKTVAAMHDRDNSSMWRKERTLKIKEYTMARKLIKLLADE